MALRFVDVGIAVKDLESAIQTYSDVLRTTPILLPSEYYAYPSLKGARFELGNASISLVASEDDQSPVARFVNSRGEGVNHITFEVDDLQKQVEVMLKLGVRFGTTQPLRFGGGKAIFAHPQSLHGVQVAFMQSDGQSSDP